MTTTTTRSGASLERSPSPLERQTLLWRQMVAAHQRLNFLSEAGGVLVESFDTARMLDRLTRLAVPKVADWCVVDLFDDDGRLQVASAAAVDPRKAELLKEIRRRYPPHPERHPIYQSIKLGRPLLVTRMDQAKRRSYAGSPGHLRALKQLGIDSFVCAPLKAGRRAIGALSMGRGRGREMTSADVELVNALSLRLGAALENGRLYAQASHADERLSRALSANRMAAWSWDSSTARVQRSRDSAVYGSAELGDGLLDAARLAHPDDRPRYEGALRRAAFDGVPYVERFRLLRADGSVAWIEEHAGVSPAEAGARRVSAVVMDVTERKFAEDELKLQAEVSRVLGEAGSPREALPRVLSAIGQAMNWTSGACWLVSNPPDALEPAGSWKAPMPRRLGPGEALAGAAWSRGQATSVCGIDARSADAARLSCGFAFPALGMAGVLGVLELHGDKPAVPASRCTRLFEVLGRQIGLYLERQNAMSALERQRREQQEILDTVPAMIWYKDAQNRVLRCNRAAARWYGKPIAEIEGKSAAELFPASAREYHRLDLAVIRSGKPRLGVIEECVSPTGRRCWVRRDIIPRLDEAGAVAGVIVFAVDITLIKRAQDALEQSERAQRDFVANVSHEFRTPVAAIKGFAETLRRGGLEDKQNRLGFVRTIESHADRLDWLVQDLLDLSRLGAGMVRFKREAIAVGPFLAGYVETMGALLERKKLRAEVDVPPKLVAVGDRPHLVQVLDNLVSNAIRYSPPGTAIRVSARAEGRLCRISVADEGCGIAAEHLPRLFDRFYRVEKRDSGGSTGLGLHIVKTIVEAQGGRVRVESRVGRGSTFHVLLPRR